ncbi:MAG: hypothetical protein U9R44_00670 [Candidatus Omnitrophota bacterium]|nr:hypothetical protein [Candidatus Omnitrophota bacterium]
MPSNKELLKELKEMRELIRKQGERISDPGRQLKEQGDAMAGQQEKVDKKLKALEGTDVSERLKRELSLLERSG